MTTPPTEKQKIKIKNGLLFQEICPKLIHVKGNWLKNSETQSRLPLPVLKELQIS